MKAFSLIELLVVIAIMALVLTLVVPSVTSLLESTNLSQAGQTVSGEISLARQIASARNCTVQICLIKLANGSQGGFGAMQLWTNGTGSTMTPASRLATLPQGIVISQDPVSMSPLLTSATSGTIPSGFSTAKDAYSAFQIRASGQVMPVTGMTNLYLTLVPMRFATNSTPPANYVSIQINPNTGAPLIYRP